MDNNLGNKQTMAINIRRYMEEKGVSSVEVCEALGVPKATFSNWCNGVTYPRIDKIEKMAKFFGVTKSDLVEDYNEEERKRNELERAYNTPGFRELFQSAQDASYEELMACRAFLETLRNTRK